MHEELKSAIKNESPNDLILKWRDRSKYFSMEGSDMMSTSTSIKYGQLSQQLRNVSPSYNEINPHLS